MIRKLCFVAELHKRQMLFLRKKNNPQMGTETEITVANANALDFIFS